MTKRAKYLIQQRMHGEGWKDRLTTSYKSYKKDLSNTVMHLNLRGSNVVELRVVKYYGFGKFEVLETFKRC